MYKYNKTKKRSKLTTLTAGFVVFMSGGYLFVLLKSPTFYIDKNQHMNYRVSTVAEETERQINTIVIPKIGVTVPYFTGGSESLEKGAWWRFPERGNPESGGNMIISAHRFQLRLTPSATAVKSPFYNIDKLTTGDELYIIYNNKNHKYIVESKTKVNPSQLEIEDETTSARVTLYTCTFGGVNEGREVIIARPAS